MIGMKGFIMANLTISKENMFDFDLDVLINPVNCKGSVEKKVSQQFSVRFPRSQKNYQNTCKREIFLPDATGRKRKVKALQPGDILHYIDLDSSKMKEFQSDEDMTSEKLQELISGNVQNIIYFATKNKPKKPVKEKDISIGLKNLKKLLEKDEMKDTIKSIGFPFLGTTKEFLESEIQDIFKDLDYDIYLFFD